MAVSSLSLNLASSTTLYKKLNLPTSSSTSKPSAVSLPSTITCSLRDSSYSYEDIYVSGNCKRRPLLLGVGALALSLLPARSLLAEGTMVDIRGDYEYEAFVDVADGYSYYYPSDWVDFDYRGHDSAFKDRHLQLQNVRLSFIPTEKSDIHDMGPRDEVVTNLLRHVYSAPTQKVTVFDMQERTTDGKNYYTFEYALTSRNFSRAAFATIAVGNGRYYTLIVGANERRWKRVRNQLKVVADSFKVLDT